MKKNYKLFTASLISAAVTSINAQCPVPSLVTASPSSICVGSTSTLNATAAGATINWFDAAVAGTYLGASASAANFTVNPIVTTTYYAGSLGSSSTGTNTFAYTGASQTYTVPAGVTSITVVANGAQGGNTSAFPGGLGGRAVTAMTVTPGQVLNIYVGGQGAASVTGGFNGGGSGGTSGSTGSGGGGASDIRVGGTALANRVIVAAGGGGSGTSFTSNGGAGGSGSACVSPYGVGGAPGTGCSTGNAGSCAGGTATSYGTGGGGGGLNSGGGISGDGSGGPGGAGALGIGGIGGTLVNGAGGGGGGYYGGAGGQSGSGGCHGGGGGGSSYSAFNPAVFTGGANTGNGSVSIIYPNCISLSRTAVTVTVNPTPTISVTSGAICAGNSYTMVASGAGTYTYTGGSAVVTPTANTSYSVTGTSTLGCVGSNTAVSSVTVNASPSVVASTSNSIICSGSSVVLTASTSATSYTWNTGATTMSVSVSPTVTSTYTVNVSNAAACVASSTVMVTVNACTGINEATANSISIYPNPTNGVVNINLTSELAKNASLEVYDALGKLVVKQALANESNTINISNLDNGIYTFKVLNNTNTVKIGKLIKQ